MTDRCSENCEISGAGCVYILESKNSSSIKIGGSSFPPAKRLKEINSSEPYKSLGPWCLYDFIGVRDWRTVERNIHYVFSNNRALEIPGQRELFAITPLQASRALHKIGRDYLSNSQSTRRMLNHHLFSVFLASLFQTSGLFHWLEQQGIWTLSLFPSTNGGRYFTINIGTHEVAFATMGKEMGTTTHMFYMDELVLEHAKTKRWIHRHKASIYKNAYKTALPKGLSVQFEGDFSVALEFLEQEGVRRAILAYWTEQIVRLADAGALSPYIRFHDYNAVVQLIELAK